MIGGALLVQDRFKRFEVLYLVCERGSDRGGPFLRVQFKNRCEPFVFQVLERRKGKRRHGNPNDAHYRNGRIEDVSRPIGRLVHSIT